MTAPLPPELEADITLIRAALGFFRRTLVRAAAVVPGVPPLVLTGGWEPLYEEVADSLGSTGAEHRQVGGNHRRQDTGTGQKTTREFLDRHRRAENRVP